MYVLSIRLTDEETGSGKWIDWDLLDLTEDEANIVVASQITRDTVKALWRKQIDGAKEHGYAMQPGDDVDALQNAFEETLDLAQYLMKAIREVESPKRK